MKVEVKPTGKLVRGHVLDCNPKHVEEKLKAYDPFLYITWNPKKLRGWGCWEIRRRPVEKMPVDVVDVGDFSIIRLEYAEINLVNHVLDVAFMNYSVINKIVSMDTWNKDHWWHHQDYLIAKKQEAWEDNALKEMSYNVKQNKKAIRDFMEMVRSGHNPARILASSKWVYDDK